MSGGVKLRKCVSFDTKDRRLQEIKQSYVKKIGEMETQYECNECREMKNEIKELKDTVKELLKDKNLRHDMREISDEEGTVNCSIQLKRGALRTDESSRKLGKDNGGFSSSSECSKQTDITSDHVVDITLGKI